MCVRLSARSILSLTLSFIRRIPSCLRISSTYVFCLGDCFTNQPVLGRQIWGGHRELSLLFHLETPRFALRRRLRVVVSLQFILQHLCMHLGQCMIQTSLPTSPLELQRTFLWIGRYYAPTAGTSCCDKNSCIRTMSLSVKWIYQVLRFR
jgi:hypothetical protein